MCTYRILLAVILRNLRAKEKEYSQNQGDTDIQPSVDKKGSPGEIAFNQMKNGKGQNGRDNKGDETLSPPFEIVCDFILHIQMLFENCHKANCNQKAKSNESEHNPHTL